MNTVFQPDIEAEAPSQLISCKIVASKSSLYEHPVEIIINGENAQIDSDSSISVLVEHLGLGEKRLAIELNQEIVPRSEYTRVLLHENDAVEIVHAIGGG